MTTWPATKAKAKLSAVLDKAESEGPQRVTRRGRKTCILLTEEEWKERTEPKETFGQFLLNSPLRGSGLKIPRLKGTFRGVKF
jgi:prevent-host-death family protein